MALPPAVTTTQPAAGEETSDESEGLGALVWILLAGLAAALIAAWFIVRSRRKSAWDAEAAGLERETRAVTGTQLPAVLTTETLPQRALSWPPLRAGLVDLIRRWDLLADRASGEERRTWSAQIRSLLEELVAALDAENEAMVAERDWRLLRPRVEELRQALSGLLARLPGRELEEAPGPDAFE